MNTQVSVSRDGDVYVVAYARSGSMKIWVGICFCKEMEHILARVKPLKPLKQRRSIMLSKCLELAAGHNNRSKIREINAHQDRTYPA